MGWSDQAQLSADAAARGGPRGCEGDGGGFLRDGGTGAEQGDGDQRDTH